MLNYSPDTQCCAQFSLLYLAESLISDDTSGEKTDAYMCINKRNVYKPTVALLANQLLYRDILFTALQEKVIGGSFSVWQ